MAPGTEQETPQSAGTPAQDADTGPRRVRVRFTGTGGEYFRIWIVNLFLTVVTLGVYSAWAKVRKLQYFYRNTQLDGSAFDFHGRPLAILKGRIIAVVLVIAYKLSERMLGPYALLALLALIAVLPWLLTQSYRFRLHNSSFRGLRFRFSGPVSHAYLIFGLPALVALTPGAMMVLGEVGDPRHPDPRFLVTIGLIYLVLMLFGPYLHFLFKRWQHGNASYGTARASFGARAWDFYSSYLLVALIMLGAALLAAALGGVFGVAAVRHDPSPRGMGGAVFVGLFTFYGAMIAVAPFLMARIQNTVWSATRLGEVAFSSSVGAWRLIGITLTNLLMIVFSLGLLIPFAVIRSMKYRIEAVEVQNAGELARVGRGSGDDNVGTTGEGAMDVMDLDFGL